MDDEDREIHDIDDIEDDSDWEDWDDEDIYLEDEDLLLPGSTVWSAACVIVTAVGDIAHAGARFWDNLRTELAYRHNKSIDQSEFIGSVEAGIERL